MKELGESLKTWRTYRRYSIAELAKISQVDYHTIYRTEHGTHKGMHWEDLYKVACTLGVETLGQLAEGAPDDG